MGEEMVMQMLDHNNSDLPNATKVALDLTEDFILNHAANVNDTFMNRLKEYFREDQIVELTIAIGTWDSVHKFNAVFDVDPPELDQNGLFSTGRADVMEDMRQHLTCLGIEGDPGHPLHAEQLESSPA